jgi:hypothetical protein
MNTNSRHHLERIQDRSETSRAAVRQDENVSAEWSQQDEIIGLLSSVTETVKNSTEIRGNQYMQIVQQLATLESKIEHVVQDVGILCKLVRDGNGQPSIIQRLANLETCVQNQQKDIEECSQHANSIIASKYLTKSQLVVGFAGMIVTALLSALALFAQLAK